MLTERSASSADAALQAMLPLAIALKWLADGHGSMVTPPPRNMIDSDVPPWSTAAAPSASSPWIPLSSGLCYADGAASQACFWFSAGCAIGCKTCDGRTRGPNPAVPCGNVPRNSSVCARKAPVCADGIKQPLLPKEARTVNTDAEDGAANDYYQFSPWRAPGSSGIPDPCGVAGGMVGGPSPEHGFDISFINTPHAKAGDPQAVWDWYSVSKRQWRAHCGQHLLFRPGWVGAGCRGARRAQCGGRVTWLKWDGLSTRTTAAGRSTTRTSAVLE